MGGRIFVTTVGRNGLTNKITAACYKPKPKFEIQNKIQMSVQICDKLLPSHRVLPLPLFSQHLPRSFLYDRPQENNDDNEELDPKPHFHRYICSFGARCKDFRLLVLILGLPARCSWSNPGRRILHPLICAPPLRLSDRFISVLSRSWSGRR